MLAESGTVVSTTLTINCFFPRILRVLMHDFICKLNSIYVCLKEWRFFESLILCDFLSAYVISNQCCQKTTGNVQFIFPVSFFQSIDV